MVWRCFVGVDDVHAVFSVRNSSRICMGAYAKSKNKNQEPGLVSGNYSDLISFTCYRTIYHLAGTNLTDRPQYRRGDSFSSFSHMHNTSHFYRPTLFHTCHDKYDASELVLFNSKPLTLLALCSLQCGISYRFSMLSVHHRALYKH